MLNIHQMEILDLMYGIFVILAAEAIIRVIDSSSEIKDKLTSLLKLNKKKSKTEVYLNDPPVVACAKCKSAYWNRDRNTFFTFAEGKIFDKE